jgi:hypothetical protein
LFSISEGGLGVQIYFCSIELYWESRNGATFMRERPCGRWQWVLNAVVCGVGDVQMRFIDRMRWGYGKISKADGGSFLII